MAGWEAAEKAAREAAEKAAEALKKSQEETAAARKTAEETAEALKKSREETAEAVKTAEATARELEGARGTISELESTLEDTRQALAEASERIDAYLVPVFLSQPQTATAAYGDAVTFSARAQYAEGLQWQEKRAGQEEWADLDGETAEELQVEASKELDGCAFRCVATGRDGSVAQSDTAYLNCLPQLFGFGLTVPEFHDMAATLYTDALAWNEETVPQNLDDFHVFPQEFTEIVKKADAICVNTSADGKSLEVCFDTEPIFSGHYGDASSDRVLGILASGKIKDFYKTGENTYRCDLSEAGSYAFSVRRERSWVYQNWECTGSVSFSEAKNTRLRRNATLGKRDTSLVMRNQENGMEVLLPQQLGKRE